MSMSDPPAPDAPIDAPAELERLRTATYTARDPDHLVTAVIDGDGVVVRIRFAGMVGTRTPDVVESAVLTAVGAAQEQIDDAWRELAARVDPERAEPDEPPASATEDLAEGGVAIGGVRPPDDDAEGDCDGTP